MKSVLSGKANAFLTSLIEAIQEAKLIASGDMVALSLEEVLDEGQSKSLSSIIVENNSDKEIPQPFETM